MQIGKLTCFLLFALVSTWFLGGCGGVSLFPPGGVPPVGTIVPAGVSFPAAQDITFGCFIYDPDGDEISSYTWDMGDGDIRTGADLAQVTKNYDSAGKFEILLTATDDEGDTCQAKSTIIIGDLLPSPPGVSVDADDFDGIAPFTVNFTSTALDPDGGPLSYSWDFGDGGTSNEANPTHTYDLPKTYRPTLTVTDEDDNSSDAFLSLEVLTPPDGLDPNYFNVEPNPNPADFDHGVQGVVNLILVAGPGAPNRWRIKTVLGPIGIGPGDPGFRIVTPADPNGIPEGGGPGNWNLWGFVRSFTVRSTEDGPDRWLWYIVYVRVENPTRVELEKALVRIKHWPP